MCDLLEILIPDERVAPNHGAPRSLRSLIASLIAISPELRAHGDRVNAFAQCMIENLPPADRAIADLVRLTATLHDLGKLSVDPGLLERAGPFTPAEYLHVQRHANIGANLLESMAPGHAVVAAVRHCHEWWNGNGYPAGISGMSIPLVSRIVAVADAYDAMTSPRPYRTVLDPADAIDELIRCAGTQFDPAMVKSMVDSAGYQKRCQPSIDAPERSAS